MARDKGSYRRFRSARRNRLLAAAVSTRLLSSIPSAALGSTTFRGRVETPSFSLESSFCTQFSLDCFLRLKDTYLILNGLKSIFSLIYIFPRRILRCRRGV